MVTTAQDVEPSGPVLEGERACEGGGSLGHANVLEMAPPESRTARAPAKKKRRLVRPAVDERLVMPETRFEILDGKVEYVPPADEPHGVRH